MRVWDHHFQPPTDPERRRRDQWVHVLTQDCKDLMKYYIGHSLLRYTQLHANLWCLHSATFWNGVAPLKFDKSFYSQAQNLHTEVRLIRRDRKWSIPQTGHQVGYIYIHPQFLGVSICFS